MKRETVFLKGNESMITQSSENAYKIVRGSVFVYMAPSRQQNETGRRLFLHEAVSGEMIPGFSYHDIDYCDWKFVFVAAEEAEIQILYGAATSVLQRRFCEKAGVTAYQTEGFQNSLVDRYRQTIVAEDSFIRRSQNNREKAHKDVDHLLKEEISPKKMPCHSEHTDNKLYNAAALLCRRYKMNLVSYEKLVAACGESITLDDMARLSCFACKEITLPADWRRSDLGALIVFDKKERPFVCLPRGNTSYTIYDAESGAHFFVTKKRAAAIKNNAYGIYRTLPPASLEVKDVASFCIAGLCKQHIVWALLFSALSAFAGLLLPWAFQQLFDAAVPSGDAAALPVLGCVAAVSVVVAGLTALAEKTVGVWIAQRIAGELQGAVIYHLFHLPQRFLRQYETADLAQRVTGVARLTYILMTGAVTAAGAVLCAVIFLLRMPFYSLKLTAAGLVTALGCGALYYVTAAIAVRRREKAAVYKTEAVSTLYRLLNGVADIRMAGAEDRALLEYFKPYVRERNIEERIMKANGLRAALPCVTGAAISAVFYFVTAAGGDSLSLGTLIAFLVLFLSFFGCLMQIVSSAVSVRREWQHIKRIMPVFEAAPETDSEKELPGALKGDIKIENLSFTYGQGEKNVLNGISLHIKPGEYIGVVGRSGCGKTTLLKLLLGIETPSSGTILYDNKDILALNRQELRKRFGVVMQDGKLIAGSIWENITVTAPNATPREVRAAVKAAGLEKDINDMPMGLHTILSEEGETISGGQLQRILLARAFLSDPDIVFLDEATASLDNNTQRLVTETIRNMAVTRVVIAHRLSTVIYCDRILVMKDGFVAESGTYSELMEAKGLFCQLASRQMM